MIRRGGFTLAEVMLAGGLLAVVLMAVIALTTSTLKLHQKATLLGPATQACDSLLQRSLYQITNDTPAGTRDSFWNHAAATPWRGPTAERIGSIDYQYALYATTVNDTGGLPFGGAAPGNRLKRLDVHLWWWNRTRAGMGRLEVQGGRLVHEEPAP